MLCFLYKNNRGCNHNHKKENNDDDDDDGSIDDYFDDNHQRNFRNNEAATIEHRSVLLRRGVRVIMDCRDCEWIHGPDDTGRSVLPVNSLCAATQIVCAPGVVQ